MKKSPWKTVAQRRVVVECFGRWVASFEASVSETPSEVPWGLFLQVGPDEVTQMLDACPAKTLSYFKDAVLTAPRTQEAWDDAMIVGLGAYPGPYKELWAEMKDVYRTAVETLRPRFETTN